MTDQQIRDAISRRKTAQIEIDKRAAALRKRALRQFRLWGWLWM